MPRGVYDRKPKGEKVATAKKVPAAKKAVPMKAATKTSTKGSFSPSVKVDNVKVDFAPAIASKAAESMFSFQILGANINTLSTAYGLVNNDADLAKVLSDELKATVEALSTLRIETFGSSLDKVGMDEVVTDDKTPPAPAKAEIKSTPPLAVVPPPVVAVSVPAPTMPQGNSSFTPPAPPALPQH